MKTSSVGGIYPFVIGGISIVYLWITPNLGYLAGKTYSPMAARVIPALGLLLFLSVLLGGSYSSWFLLKNMKRISLPDAIPYGASILCVLVSVPVLHRAQERYVDSQLSGFGDRFLTKVDAGQIKSWMGQVPLTKGGKTVFTSELEGVTESVRQLHPYSVVVRENPYSPPGRVADIKWLAVWEAWGLQVSSPDSNDPLISKTDTFLRLQPGVFVYIQMK